MLLQIVQRLAALASLALLGLGGYLVWSWWDHREALEAGLRLNDDFGWRLWLGGALVAGSFLGRPLVLCLLGRPGPDRARLTREPGRRLETPNGAVLETQATGPESAPALILVHGWGMDASTWWDARRRLATRYRVVSYDLAGLGRSRGPADGAYSLERFADDLAAVVASVAPRRSILVGHSIGGMIVQTLARRHPKLLGREVQGLVLENTTHTDPTRTMVMGGLVSAMKPLLRALMRLDVMLSPLVWAMNWQSYVSGWTHVAMRLGFGSRPTRAQLEQVARLATRNSPAVQAKGNLAMMAWDATADLGRLTTPTLVFLGGRDLVTLPTAGETIARNARQARPIPVAEAGHMGPLEFADIYNREIEVFADAVFTRGAAWADQPLRAPPAPAAPETDAAPPRQQPGRSF